jgi:hypothetical protein
VLADQPFLVEDLETMIPAQQLTESGKVASIDAGVVASRDLAIPRKASVIAVSAARGR